MTLRKLRTQAVLQFRDGARIDRANLRIHGSVAMLANVEALGHDCMSDLTTLHMMQSLGNARARGVQGRFGHPGMSENSAGRKIMTAHNFRVQDEKLVHDIQFLEPARRSPAFENDVVDYIFDMAEQHPEEIAESVVISAQFMWLLDDGRELDADKPGGWPEDIRADDQGRPLNATTPFPVIRPHTFYYVDIVNEGALTHDGLFSPEFAQDLFMGSSREAAQLFEWLDEARITYNIPLNDLRRKALNLMDAYLAWNRGETDMAGRKKFEGEPIGDDAETQDSDTTTEGANQPEAEATTTEAKPKLPDVSHLAEESRKLAEKVNGSDNKPQFVPLAQYQQLEARVIELEEANAALVERLTQLVEVFQNQQSIITTLTQERYRVLGEPLVTERVPRQAHGHLHASAQGNQPPAFGNLPTPTSLAQRAKGNGKALSAEQQEIERRMAISQKLHG